MSEELRKLRDDFDTLYDRIRSNETKYMPAVEVAYGTRQDLDALRLDMKEKILNLSEVDSIQDLTMKHILERLDASDEMRKTHFNLAADTANKLENHMIEEEKNMQFYKNILKYIIVPSMITVGGYMLWLGEQVIDIQKTIAIHLNDKEIHKGEE